MTLDRRFTLPAHGVIELGLGMLTLLSPALFGFGSGGLVLAFVLGAVLIGMAVTINAEHGSSPAWHHLLDLAFGIVAALAALGLALAGEASAAVFLAALAGVQSGLNLATRYVVAS